MVSKGPIFYFIEVKSLLIHKHTSEVMEHFLEGSAKYIMLDLVRIQKYLKLGNFLNGMFIKAPALKNYVSTEICYKKSTKLFNYGICYIFLVILFLFPYTFSETITANILWQMIIFLGFTVVPISLAYSHIGVRTFASNRWNNFTQSPSMILP